MLIEITRGVLEARLPGLRQRRLRRRLSFEEARTVMQTQMYEMYYMRKTRAARFQDAREAVARKIITMKKEQLEKKTRLTEAKVLLEARAQNRATGTTCRAVLGVPACSQSLDEKQEEKQSSKVHKAFKEVDVRMKKQAE